MGEGWISFSEAAQKLNTSEQNIILWAHQGKLESDGEKIKESSLASFIDNHTYSRAQAARVGQVPKEEITRLLRSEQLESVMFPRKGIRIEKEHLKSVTGGGGHKKVAYEIPRKRMG